MNRCTWMSSSCLATEKPFARTNWPEGRNALLPPVELAVMAVGGHGHVGPARGAELGADGEGIDVCLAASRPRAVMPLGRLLERTVPPVPKLVSRVPLALNRASAP